VKTVPDSNNKGYEISITDDISSDHWVDLDNKILALNPESDFELSSSILKSYYTGNLRQYFAGDIDSPENFTMNFSNIPKIVLCEPSNGSCISNNKPTFQWKFMNLGSSNQVTYQVLISNNSDFRNINYNSGEQISSNEYWEFPKGTKYTEITDGVWYWKVIAKNINLKC